LLNWRAALAGAALAAASTAHAGFSRYCDDAAVSNAAQQDRLFRFAAVIKTELDSSSLGVALVSRAGLDLSRFDQRYSHAGFSLKHSPQTPWAVRQLYYECGAAQSRLFDQGLTAFLLGARDPTLGFISVVLLPEAAAAELERAVLDNARALRLLSPHYSANAFAFNVQFQNCNQWVAEMLAAAWGLGETDAQAAEPPRQRAQTWLQGQGYVPTVFDVGWHALMWASALSPWLHHVDHPIDDLAALRFRVSMPASLEAFMHQRWPQAQRIEFCHTEQHVVVRRGWHAISSDCQPEPGDAVLALN
jgi:hypothetical protein